MPQRIVIISDTHFGRERGGVRWVDSLRPLWRNAPGERGFGPATRFIINGDVAEVHHPDHWRKATRQAKRLFKLCKVDRIPLTILSGNHDPYLTDERHLYLAGGRILVMHGDALHPAIAPWSPHAGRIHEKFDAAMAEVDPELRDDLSTRLRVAQRASEVQWTRLAREAERSSLWRMLVRPWAIARVLWYWRIAPRLAAEFAEKHAPETQMLILGHTHHPGIWTVRGRTIINTGSFGFPGRPRATIVGDDAVAVWPIRRRSKRYEYGPKPVATIRLEPSCAERITTESPALR